MGNVKQDIKKCFFDGVISVIDKIQADWAAELQKAHKNEIVARSMTQFELDYGLVGILEIIEVVFDAIFTMISVEFPDNISVEQNKKYFDICKKAKETLFNKLNNEKLL